MKKGKIKKLRLSKLTIASLDREKLSSAQAGQIARDTQTPDWGCGQTSPQKCDGPSMLIGCTHNSRPPHCPGG